jgi:hypothetical protein
MKDRIILAGRALKLKWKRVNIRPAAQFVLEAFVFAIVFQVVAWLVKI